MTYKPKTPASTSTPSKAPAQTPSKSPATTPPKPREITESATTRYSNKDSLSVTNTRPPTEKKK